jgi:hypothetical protein
MLDMGFAIYDIRYTIYDIRFAMCDAGCEIRVYLMEKRRSSTESQVPRAQNLVTSRNEINRR